MLFNLEKPGQVITMTAPNRNYNLEEKIKFFFFAIPFIWLNNLNSVDARKSNLFT